MYTTKAIYFDNVKDDADKGMRDKTGKFYIFMTESFHKPLSNLP